MVCGALGCSEPTLRSTRASVMIASLLVLWCFSEPAVVCRERGKLREAYLFSRLWRHVPLPLANDMFAMLWHSQCVTLWEEPVAVVPIESRGRGRSSSPCKSLHRLCLAFLWRLFQDFWLLQPRNPNIYLTRGVLLHFASTLWKRREVCSPAARDVPRLCKTQTPTN